MTEKPICARCSGAGWLWWHELEEYFGPALVNGRDDTKYMCDGPEHPWNRSRAYGER
jgi:hypothetical protein